MRARRRRSPRVHHDGWSCSRCRCRCSRRWYDAVGIKAVTRHSFRGWGYFLPFLLSLSFISFTPPVLPFSLSLSRLEMAPEISGVTRVGDTRRGNWGCHPFIFSWKTWRPFILVIAVTITIAFHCFHSGVTPRGCHPHLFYMSDLVSPLFFVNVPIIFFLRVSPPLEGVTRGRNGPPPAPAPL